MTTYNIGVSSFFDPIYTGKVVWQHFFKYELRGNFDLLIREINHNKEIIRFMSTQSWTRCVVARNNGKLITSCYI